MTSNNSSTTDFSLQSCFEMINNNTNMTDFDYLNQPFVLLLPSGGFVTMNTNDIHTQQVQLVQMAAVFAAQLGAALTTAIVLLLMATPAKCKNLPFVFNILALVTDVARCALLIAQLTSGLSNFAVINLWIFDDPEVQRGVNEGVAGAIFTFLLFLLIELALITQVRVVCAAASSTHHALITAFSVVVGLLAIALRLYLTILNIRSMVDVGSVTSASQGLISRAQYMSNVSSIVSICVFSAIFCVKLALAIKSRRSMGLKQFGPMQIIFIMGCQTLIVPGKSNESKRNAESDHVTAIFAILAYSVITGAQIQSCVETIVAIFLPLSSIWASANTSAKLQNGNQTAVIALPEYRCKKSDESSTSNNTLDTRDGLDKEERTFRSKYDSTSQTSTHSIDKYISVLDGERTPHNRLST